jgi:hypothetical protein
MGLAGADFGGCVISTIAGSFVVIADKHGALANSETFRPDLQYRGHKQMRRNSAESFRELTNDV